ncbi:conserved repeat domain protein [Haladaptatus paucihalophilus DX253]|uniref:Conserved repeat domain protein n=1 Tax=Haladaptatus paucihalophilus DX253 TaxID=797209 RepID=E7QWA6_HALPU|nr:DUF58 domain-containing protein [Haladaptatus paucihalophilus]EFW91240.1 conserved repeat domain protein [Haladaptatus paucihalophilus DX253]SHL66574.1 Uncharacterized conserved protein, DUF58 family, contains vWF domain [Haladaptatus paucihalophilus DX253]
MTETHRWRGVIALSLAAGAVGLAVDRPSMLLLAVVGVVFAAYPRVVADPEPKLRLERRLSNSTPRPGDEVTVTVTVTNEGGFLPDVRIVDGVPALLSVSGGSPRNGAVFWPGRSVRFSYRIQAKHGKHPFEPATVVARDLSGAREVETTVAADTELDCTATGAEGPLRDKTLDQVGRIVAQKGGSGIEFHRTREYRAGDAMHRIDWNRYARTGSLTTVEYREENAATVVVLVDARRVAYRSTTDEPHAVAYSVSAAEQLLASLHRDRNLVGLAAFGREQCWLEPGAGRSHRANAQRLLATHTAFASLPPTEEADHEEQVEQLRTRLPSAAQVVLLSPLSDQTIVETARRLDAYGHRISVISPDVTADESVGQRLAGVERENRLSELRKADIPVVEWDPETPLAAALLDRPRRVRA